MLARGRAGRGLPAGAVRGTGPGVAAGRRRRLGARLGRVSGPRAVGVRAAAGRGVECRVRRAGRRRGLGGANFSAKGVGAATWRRPADSPASPIRTDDAEHGRPGQRPRRLRQLRPGRRLGRWARAGGPTCAPTGWPKSRNDWPPRPRWSFHLASPAPYPSGRRACGGRAKAPAGPLLCPIAAAAGPAEPVPLGADSCPRRVCSLARLLRALAPVLLFRCPIGLPQALDLRGIGGGSIGQAGRRQHRAGGC